MSSVVCENFLRRDLQAKQHVGDQRQARLERPRDHFGRACCLQLLELRVVLGTHQHRQVAPEAPRRPHDPERGLRGIEGHDECARMLETECLQHLGLGGIPVDDGVAGLPRVTHAVRIEIERDELEPAALEHAREVLPDPPEATDDHVLALGEFTRRGGLERHLGRLDRAAPEDEVGDASVVSHQQRTGQHAERDGGEQRLHDPFVHRGALEQERQQREAELTAHASPRCRCAAPCGRSARTAAPRGRRSPP